MTVIDKYVQIQVRDVYSLAVLMKIGKYDGQKIEKLKSKMKIQITS